MGIFNAFKKKENAVREEVTNKEIVSRFVEFDRCGSISFSGDIYDNDLVRACVSRNALHTSKAAARVIRKTDSGIVSDEPNKRLERLLNYQPNPYINGISFLYRVRALCEIKGMAFVWIDRDLSGTPTGYYPIQYNNCEALVDDDKKLKGFRFDINGKIHNFPLADLVVLYRDYVRDNYFGESNAPLYHSLSMLKIADKGIENAITLTSNLRGILKSTMAMLDDDDRKKARDSFVDDYVNMQNKSGIASIDASQEFIPVSIDPKSANVAQMALYEKRIMRYFGTNDKILMNEFNDVQWTAYYEGSIEPFLIALSQEMTNKSFTERERGHGNEIIYESNRLLYASTSTKMQLVQLVDRGVISLNEYRTILNLPPVEGGEMRVIRKEYTGTDNLDEGGAQ